MDELRAMVFRVGMRQIVECLYKGMSRECDCLPDGWKIHSVAMSSPAVGCVDVAVMHPSFPVVKFGEELPVKVCRCPVKIRYDDREDAPAVVETTI